MFRKKSRNSSEKARDCQMEQNQIFCEEIREFVHESRKSQTAYRNFEGYLERTAEYNELTKLDDLVFLTLSDGKHRASLTDAERAETKKLAPLIVKKINNSCMKFKCNHIRFKVVWIFYFDYLEKQMKGMPVFKVYKKNQDSEASYIDISVSEYDTWDHFIMFSQFPTSFICVPRRGEYTFKNIDGEDMLDLEYICKNSQLRNKLYRNFRPFSQTLVQRMLPRVMPFVKGLIPFLDMTIIFVDNTDLRKRPEGAFVVTIISALVIFLKILEQKYGGNESQEALESTAADCSLMLLNDDGEKPSPLNKCSSLQCYVGERQLRDTSSADLTNFIKTLRVNPEKVLKCVEIIEVCKPLFVSVAGVKECVMNSFLEFLSRLLSQAVKGKVSEESEKGLCNLERYSSEKVFSELCPRLSAGKEISKAPLDLKGPETFTSDLFGFSVHLLLKYTSANCKNYLQNLLKCDFTLEEDNFFQNITLNGNLIGIVISFSFQSQNLAIIVLRLDKLQGRGGLPNE